MSRPRRGIEPPVDASLTDAFDTDEPVRGARVADDAPRRALAEPGDDPVPGRRALIEEPIDSDHEPAGRRFVLDRPGRRAVDPAPEDSADDSWADESGADESGADADAPDPAPARRAITDAHGPMSGSGRRFRDTGRAATEGEATEDVATEDEPDAPARWIEPAPRELDEDTAIHPIVVDDMPPAEEPTGGDAPADQLGPRRGADELGPRRRADGPAPRHVPARRNLRLVVGLVAVVASVSVPLVALGGKPTAGETAAAPPPVVVPVAEPSAKLPPQARAEPWALRPVPAAVPGIPQPCSQEFTWDDDASQADNVDRIGKQWDITLTGSEWNDPGKREAVELFATTLDAVDCTGYLDRVKQGNGGQLTVSSSAPRTSWAWGDYGLTRPHTVTLDMAKFQQGYSEGERGRLVRLIIHEFAHAVNTDRFQNPPYWQRLNEIYNGTGQISEYGSSPDESFADAVGYYVARCAEGNPYNDVKNQPYYDLVHDEIFRGHEFGTAVGEAQSCSSRDG